MATETGDGTETAEEMDPFVRGVTVTTLATMMGLLGGIASAVLAGGPNDIIGLGLLAIVIVVQFPVLEGFGIDTGDFGMKDRLYIFFMTFVFWFVSWGLLMTAESL